MKDAQDHQTKWADAKRRLLKFAVVTMCFLRSHQLEESLGSAAMESCLRYIRLFDIIEQVGEVIYRIVLPSALDRAHDVFRISQLRKYVRDDQNILDYSD